MLVTLVDTIFGSFAVDGGSPDGGFPFPTAGVAVMRANVGLSDVAVGLPVVEIPLESAALLLGLDRPQFLFFGQTETLTVLLPEGEYGLEVFFFLEAAVLFGIPPPDHTFELQADHEFSMSWRPAPFAVAEPSTLTIVVLGVLLLGFAISMSRKSSSKRFCGLIMESSIP